MRQRAAVVVVAIAVLAAVVPEVKAQSAEPWIGSWKLDIEKSKFVPGPPPKGAPTTTIEPASGGLKFINEGVDGEGKPFRTEFVAPLDGKEVPVTGARMPNSTTAYKRIDDRTFELVGKVGGKPTITNRAVLSADGKTLTLTQSGKNAQGEAVSSVIVYVKQ